MGYLLLVASAVAVGIICSQVRLSRANDALREVNRQQSEIILQYQRKANVMIMNLDEKIK